MFFNKKALSIRKVLYVCVYVCLSALYTHWLMGYVFMSSDPTQHCYRPKMKLREDNVFYTCLSLCSQGGLPFHNNPRPSDTVNKLAVRILLECILVNEINFNSDGSSDVIGRVELFLSDLTSKILLFCNFFTTNCMKIGEFGGRVCAPSSGKFWIRHCMI